MVNGQNHKGSTYHIGKMLADKLDGEVIEFFLPRDFGHFCVGCTQCIIKDEKLCPHYEDLKPLTDAIREADVILLTSPVYVYHCTGSMKAWLDHYGYQWMGTQTGSWNVFQAGRVYFHGSRCRNKIHQ